MASLHPFRSRLVVWSFHLGAMLVATLSSISRGQENFPGWMVISRGESEPLQTLTAADLHKFTVGAGTVYGVIGSYDEVKKTVQIKHWEMLIRGSWAPGGSIGQYSQDDQDFIKKYWAAHLVQSGTNTPRAVSPTGVAILDSMMSYLVDASGALKGKSITAIASGGDRNHYLALCSDGTLVAWGLDNLGQLGNGKLGWGALSAVPVLVDTSAFQGKAIASIYADRFGSSFALCTDGSIYTWGGRRWIDWSTTIPPHDKPELFDDGNFKGRKITTVVPAATGFLALGADGTVVGMLLGTGQTFPFRIFDQGALKGKKVTQIVSIGTNSVCNLALCADGTLVQLYLSGNTAVLEPGPMAAVENAPSAGAANVPKGRPAAAVISKIQPENLALVDTSGALKGKTITAIAAVTSIGLPSMEGLQVLCSDGTLAYWGQAPRPGSVLAARGALGSAPAVTRRGRGAVQGTLDVPYPLVVSGTGVLYEKTVVSISNGLILCSDGTQARWDGSGSVVLVDFHDILPGKTILAIDRDMVLFKDAESAKALP